MSSENMHVSNRIGYINTACQLCEEKLKTTTKTKQKTNDKKYIYKTTIIQSFKTSCALS